MSNTTIDSHSRAPDAGYLRTDAEVAHQKAYEAREASRHKSTVQIAYRIDKSKAQAHAGGRVGDAFCVVRQVGDGKEETSAIVYRQYEAISMLREAIWRDEMAAKRLGVGIHVTTTTR